MSGLECSESQGVSAFSFHMVNSCCIGFAYGMMDGLKSAFRHRKEQVTIDEREERVEVS
jgi:hypothetical protein